MATTIPGVNNIAPPNPVNTTIMPSALVKKRKLSSGALAGIIIGVLLFLGGVGVGIYFLVRNHDIHEAKQKFGSIEFVDERTGIRSDVINAGDTLDITFTPTHPELLKNIEWRVSTDGGKTYEIVLKSDEGNSTYWTIPPTLFSNACIIRVKDLDHPQQFVRTPAFTVEPGIRLASGPGVHKGGQVWIHFPLKTVITIPSELQASLTTKDNWIVELAGDMKVWNEAPGTVIKSYDASTQTLTWEFVDTNPPHIYWPTFPQNKELFYRFTTVGLNQGHELSAPSSFKIRISNATACNPDQEEFVLCSMQVLEQKSQSTPDLYAYGEDIIIRIYYEGTYSNAGKGDAFFYTEKGGVSYTLDVEFKGTDIDKTGAFIEYSSQIPAGDFTEIVIQGQINDKVIEQDLTIQSMSIVAEFQPGTSLEVYDFESYKTNYKTKITLAGVASSYFDIVVEYIRAGADAKLLGTSATNFTLQDIALDGGTLVWSVPASALDNYKVGDTWKSISIVFSVVLYESVDKKKQVNVAQVTYTDCIIVSWKNQPKYSPIYNYDQSRVLTVLVNERGFPYIRWESVEKPEHPGVTPTLWFQRKVQDADCHTTAKVFVGQIVLCIWSGTPGFNAKDDPTTCGTLFARIYETDHFQEAEIFQYSFLKRDRWTSPRVDYRLCQVATETFKDTKSGDEFRVLTTNSVGPKAYGTTCNNFANCNDLYFWSELKADGSPSECCGYPFYVGMVLGGDLEYLTG